MNRAILICVLALCAAGVGARAQDVPSAMLDGPAVAVDSSALKPRVAPAVMSPAILQMRHPLRLEQPYAYETKEQRAARINAAVCADVMRSVDEDLVWHKPVKLESPWKYVLLAARLFATYPFRVPEGYVPLMNSSFNLAIAKVPGLAPYEHPYAPDSVPMTVRSEYDAATGTYKQVMLDWSEVEKSIQKFNFTYQSVEPIPFVPLNAVERAVPH